jgi:hypothetical protein
MPELTIFRAKHHHRGKRDGIAIRESSSRPHLVRTRLDAEVRFDVECPGQSNNIGTIRRER